MDGVGQGRQAGDGMVTVLLDHPETYVPEQASTAPMGDPHKMMAPAGYVCRPWMLSSRLTALQFKKSYLRNYTAIESSAHAVLPSLAEFIC